LKEKGNRTEVLVTFLAILGARKTKCCDLAAEQQL
jgi:hypothetical protein